MQLNSVLPYRCDATSQLDKMSTVRLAVAYLKLKRIVSAGTLCRVFIADCLLFSFLHGAGLTSTRIIDDRRIFLMTHSTHFHTIMYF